MIGRAHRFHGHGSLRYVYQHGKTTRGSLFAIRSVINERRRTYRAAIVVSKKVSKSAVVRNRIRRRLYEHVRTQSPNIVRPYDIVITVFNQSVAEMPAADLQEQITALLRQADVLAHRQNAASHDMIDKKEN